MHGLMTEGSREAVLYSTYILRERIIGLKDRYDQRWQQALSELKKAKLIKNDSKIVRLLLLGAINYSAQWYKPGKSLTIDQLADQTVAFFGRVGV